MRRHDEAVAKDPQKRSEVVSDSRGYQGGTEGSTGAGIRVMKNFYYNLSIVQSRLASHFASEKSFGTERFALPHEIAHLSLEKPHDYGLILGADHFRRILQIIEGCAQFVQP
jgi:hypothetical protein